MTRRVRHLGSRDVFSFLFSCFSHTNFIFFVIFRFYLCLKIQ